MARTDTHNSPVSWLRRLSGTLEKIIEAVEEQGGTFDHLKSFVADARNCVNLGKLVMGRLEIVESELPTQITLGDRTYEILGFLKPGETSVKGDVMVQRAKEMNAHLGKEDGQWFLDHQDDIPESLRGKVAFVFTDWRDPGASRSVCYVYWHGASRRWIRHWRGLRDQWGVSDRLVRRK